VLDVVDESRGGRVVATETVVVVVAGDSVVAAGSALVEVVGSEVVGTSVVCADGPMTVDSVVALISPAEPGDGSVPPNSANPPSSSAAVVTTANNVVAQARRVPRINSATSELADVGNP
jgi:hypothetical protein